MPTSNERASGAAGIDAVAVVRDADAANAKSTMQAAATARRIATLRRRGSERMFTASRSREDEVEARRLAGRHDEFSRAGQDEVAPRERGEIGAERPVARYVLEVEHESPKSVGRVDEPRADFDAGILKEWLTFG